MYEAIGCAIGCGFDFPRGGDLNSHPFVDGAACLVVPDTLSHGMLGQYGTCPKRGPSSTPAVVDRGGQAEPAKVSAW